MYSIQNMKTKFYEVYIGSAEFENGGRHVYLKTNKTFEEEIQNKMVLEFAVLENLITNEDIDDIDNGCGFICFKFIEF